MLFGANAGPYEIFDVRDEVGEVFSLEVFAMPTGQAGLLIYWKQVFYPLLGHALILQEGVSFRCLRAEIEQRRNGYCVVGNGINRGYGFYVMSKFQQAPCQTDCKWRSLAISTNNRNLLGQHASQSVRKMVRHVGTNFIPLRRWFHDEIERAKRKKRPLRIQCCMESCGFVRRIEEP